MAKCNKKAQHLTNAFIKSQPGARTTLLTNKLSMKRTFLTLLILFILSACRQRHTSGYKSDILTFKILIHPSFDEKAQIILTKIDTRQAIQFLLLSRSFY